MWKFALQSYFRVLFLSLTTFVAVLIIARFKDIARFTALCGDFQKTGIFIVYQIPSILPIAIPISALLASLLLFQNLSNRFELTALRAMGLSLKTILTPILLASLFLTLIHFSFSAEITPHCRREGKKILFDETSENPILLLQRQKLLKIKHAYLNMKVKDDETTKNVILIVPNQNRLNLITARKLFINGEQLIGNDLAIVSSVGDALIIENQSAMKTAAPLISKVMKKRHPRIDLNAMNLKMLYFRGDSAARIELLRRISLSLAVFSFTFLGSAFGIEQARKPSKKNLVAALLLTLTVLISYLLAKGLKHDPILSLFAFLLPHPFIWACSSFHLWRISKGTI